MPELRLCSIPNCGKTLYARTWCKKHYMSWYATGTPVVAKPKACHGEAPEYFRTVVMKYEADECLIWPYSKVKKGYGNMRHEGRTVRVHRLVCSLKHGPAPSDIHHAAHACGNRLCVNHRHIYWALPAKNQEDQLGHGTRARGERQGMSKLTEKDVRNIRELAESLSHPAIAERFGVAPSAVSKIVLRKRWAWLD